jgi:hypothetical protein
MCKYCQMGFCEGQGSSSVKVGLILTNYIFHLLLERVRV